ncbi:MAG: type II toxin-antitoxin system VapC family toxin [Methanobacterium sp.]|nr:type II toxin-antitoxin system VapC family toxin [Methanobacterium sp.]
MIFIDSTFFIALVLEDDQWHQQALKLIPKLDEADKLISEFILSETITMVGSRSGGKAGKQVYEYMMESCNIHRQDKSVYDQVIKTYLKYDGTLSFTDASTVEIMRSFNINEIVSFDSDFDKVKGIIRIS